MKNKAVKIGIFASLVPHIFCCGLPVVISIISLIAPVEAHWQIIPHYLEPWLFGFSALMLGLSWYLILGANKHKDECDCDCKENHKSQRVQKIIMSCITVIFFISLVLHFLILH